MKLLRFFLRILSFYLIAVMVLGLAYRLVPPPSTLMLAKWMTFHGVERESVPLKRISPSLLRAVIRAEDSRFCKHSGVDWDSMEEVVEKAAKRGATRGASTIPMQVAKNLFLWPQRSYIRKALEVPIALYLDIIWPKSRMMEVYLSIAEWGDGIYGAEAAAQAYFHKSANQLTPWESALLAASLPNPLKRNPAHPSSYLRNRAGQIQKWASHSVDTSCLWEKK